MPWFKIDDNFSDNAKIIAAGNEAVGLYVRCGAYSAKHLTDGHIPQHVALLYGSAELVETLIRTKLWRRVRGGYKMPDWLDYNPSKQEVVDKRQVRAEAGRKGGLASGKTRSKNEANASGLLEAKTNPRPVPSPINGPVGSGTERPLSTAVRKPDLNHLNGAASRHPSARPAADAIAEAINPDPASRGKHART